jgi:hypothetical protein
MHCMGIFTKLSFPNLNVENTAGSWINSTSSEACDLGQVHQKINRTVYNIFTFSTLFHYVNKKNMINMESDLSSLAAHLK